MRSEEIEHGIGHENGNEDKMSNKIDIEMNCSTVEFAAMLQVIVDFAVEAGLKWTDSTEAGKRPQDAIFEAEEGEITAKFPLKALKGDAEDYKICAGLCNRSVYVRLNGDKQTSYLIGPAKTRKLARDALEKLAEHYKAMNASEITKLEEDQVHLLPFLRFPPYYVDIGNNVHFDHMQQQKVDRLKTDSDKTYLEELVNAIMTSGLSPWIKKEIVVHIVNKCEMELEDIFVDELMKESVKFEKNVNASFVKRGRNQRSEVDPRVEHFEFENDDDDLENMAESVASASTATAKAKPEPKVKKEYVPRR